MSKAERLIEMMITINAKLKRTHLAAYCTTANQIRVFRGDRIREIIEEKPCPKGKYLFLRQFRNILKKQRLKTITT